ncbi:hypothetical protein F0L74_03630 [Chitinophaga agrisoli]|uniref:Transcriptional regulator, AbiEi antitoxin, Type IV TA system n=1 Tax=Chitinophaga agrisoli TaxID=2607653 RepID=A0A5B2W1Z6_9BACT|nr:DUF6088 family protein [Chitinophaga agrisoli]KAA2245064.1 hypothetical protein F0L74_03630 [Chitinophaga agrisoli]
MHKSIHNEIVNRIKKFRKGTIIFPSTFYGMANTATIRTSLYRLAKDKLIVRLGQGIFLYPKTDPELGTLYPSLEEIANAIADRDQIVIKPTGAAAMQSLGLSTQVPMNIVFLTDGPSRKIKVLNHTITFKKMSPKKLAATGEISARIFLALHEMARNGQLVVTDDVMNNLRELVLKEDSAVLQKDLKRAPAWIADLILKILLHQNSTEDDRMATTNRRKTD